MCVFVCVGERMKGTHLFLNRCLCMINMSKNASGVSLYHFLTIFWVRVSPLTWSLSSDFFSSWLQAINPQELLCLCAIGFRQVTSLLCWC